LRCWAERIVGGARNGARNGTGDSARSSAKRRGVRSMEGVYGIP
jgi:hypothetical protein